MSDDTVDPIGCGIGAGCLVLSFCLGLAAFILMAGAGVWCVRWAWRIWF